MKALQKDVDDKKAERETLLYVGYIRHVCTTILSIPRMQIYTIYISICMSCSLATAIARYNGSSCLEKDDDYLKNLSASLILCTASQSCAAAKRVHVDSK